jgi:hypothetical protein
MGRSVSFELRGYGYISLLSGLLFRLSPTGAV